MNCENFKFPECWSDDMRMSSLFAPFRPKSVNPTDWHSKMKFWTYLIESWCKHLKSPVIKISDLKNSFSRNGLSPACLEEVIQYMFRSGILIRKENFLSPAESWTSWTVKVLTNPLKWTFNTVKSSIVKEIPVEVCYIHLPVIKYLGEDLFKKVISTQESKVLNYEELTKLGIDNPENLSLILHWLKKQGLVDVGHKNDETLIKFCKKNLKEVKITEVDMGIYCLEKQQKFLEENIKQLEKEREVALTETKKHIVNKMKNMAKISLRRKLEIEKVIEKRALTLENIRKILQQIDQAKLDSEVIDAYQKGIATLKKIFKETGLNEETVTDTMDELQNVLNSRNEIEEALARPMDPTLEENFEDELNELLLEDAPEVPMNELSVSQKEMKKEEKRKKKDAEAEVVEKLEALSI